MNFLKQKKAGLPIWAWAAIAAVVIFGLFVIMRRRGTGSSSGSNATPLDVGQAAANEAVPSASSGGGGDGSGFYSPDQGSSQFPYWIGGGGGPFTDFPNIPTTDAPPAVATPDTTTSPTKPASTAVKSTSTKPLFRQTGSSLGSTTAPNQTVQKASYAALKTARRQKKSPAASALAARSAGLNAAYGLNRKPKKRKK